MQLNLVLGCWLTWHDLMTPSEWEVSLTNQVDILAWWEFTEYALGVGDDENWLRCKVIPLSTHNENGEGPFSWSVDIHQTESSSSLTRITECMFKQGSPPALPRYRKMQGGYPCPIGGAEPVWSRGTAWKGPGARGHGYSLPVKTWPPVVLCTRTVMNLSCQKYDIG